MIVQSTSSTTTTSTSCPYSCYKLGSCPRFANCKNTIWWVDFQYCKDSSIGLQWCLEVIVVAVTFTDCKVDGSYNIFKLFFKISNYFDQFVHLLSHVSAYI